ncbi:hypothetical protein SMICM304S_09303 [Streptomyces microflavus]
MTRGPVRESRTGPLRRMPYGLGLRFSPSIPRPGRSPGSSGGSVTSGAGRGGVLGRSSGDGWVRPSVGRSSSSPSVPPLRRPSSGAEPEEPAEPEGFGAVLESVRPSEGAGGAGAGSSVRGIRCPVWWSRSARCPRCRPGCGEEGLERGDVVLYGLEDRADLVADVGELDGQPVADAAPGGAVRAGEGVQGLHGADGAVALVGGVEQAVALGGVVGHAVECASDGAEGFVVQLAGAAALHESAGLAEPGGRLVEVDLAAVGVALGHAEADVLHPALQPVQRVTGQGVGAGSGHSAERAGCHTHGEPTGGEPFRPAGAGTQFAQW